MPWVGFEPTVSAGERPKTYALDRAATGTGGSSILLYLIDDARSNKNKIHMRKIYLLAFDKYISEFSNLPCFAFDPFTISSQGCRDFISTKCTKYCKIFMDVEIAFVVATKDNKQLLVHAANDIWSSTSIGNMF